MDANSNKLRHELEVHQLELEAQNAELKLSKERAEEEAAKYLELYEASPTGYISLTREGEILDINPAGAEILRKDRINLKKNRLGFFISNDTRLIFSLFLERIFSNQTKESCEVALSLKGEIHMDVNLTGIVTTNGENCLVTLVDITDRKRNSILNSTNKELLYQNDEKAKHSAELLVANEAIAFQRDRLEKIASLVPGLVYQYRLFPDGSSCFLYVSDAISQIYRITPEEAYEDASKTFNQIHPDDLEQVLSSLQKSARDLSPWKHDYRVKFEDGTLLQLHGNAIPRLEADGSILWYGFITDISERIERERKIKLQNEMLQKLISEREKFFSIIGHDLRGPMGSLMQLAEILADEERTKNEGDTKELIADISLSARNTFHLLENLLEWSRIDKGKFYFNPIRTRLNDVVNECKSILMAQASSKNITITSEIENELFVLADQNMLKLIIRNLISNALKYSHKGGEIFISATSVENNQTLVSVKDSGIGIPDELKNSLFLFDGNTLKRGTQGESSTGLGLKLCLEFVEIQGGKLNVESKQDFGSVFSFNLPSDQPSQVVADSKNIKPDDSKTHTLKQLNVMIVEDDDISFSILKRAIQNNCASISRAFSGTEAIELCHKLDLDLILMDLRLPILDGLEATRQIRLFNKEVIIFAQTAQPFQYKEDNVLESGCNDYISKPIDLKKLKEMIHFHCSKND